MKKLILSTFCLLLMSKFSAGQVVEYYTDIEPIIIKNCAPCHKKNGYGPFSLTTFDEVKNKGRFIKHVTETKYMPPWKADPEFRTFKNQRTLTEDEIQTIAQWVDGGMKKGKRNKSTLEIPKLNTLGDPDLILTMKSAYELSDEAIEDFRFFHLPTNLEKTTYIKAIEFEPGNKRYVHHSRIMADTTNKMSGIDGLAETDPKVVEFQKYPLADEFLYGWVPGNLPISYPERTGKKLYANTDLILNIHYSPSSLKAQDNSKIKLYFAKEEIDHDIKTLAIREGDISNQPFYIKANTVPTFYVSYRVEEDMQLVSILPHMHYLGKSFKALALSPDGEAIPLIKIDQWDFNWQSSYFFEEPLFIPKGSTILITAEYDNTSDNPANPNSPPIDVGYGWNSTNEMMNLVMYYYDNTSNQ
ncbi:MAG: hypothetical protein ABJH05_03215 [Fulvivirga sp.]